MDRTDTPSFFYICIYILNHAKRTKVLVELSQLQDAEVGDGTTSVVIAAESCANQLVKNKIHPTTIISGYRLAMRESVRYIKKNLTTAADTLGRENLLTLRELRCHPKLSALNLISLQKWSNAVTSVRHVKEDGRTVYPVKSINVPVARAQRTRE